ncbi:hypothetical protein PAECIP111892_00240 [Paenibacillus auburnensis]|jgi:hypothetical protein|uniref:Uncharacterized protein n=1 Tax=Paenibacillus auburnensis TaxID=2905649 RepID=A0ABN8FWG8_9BACL|nr:hypothetical protein PAECIP111892_00240 [Paenibacillus auburnensis]
MKISPQQSLAAVIPELETISLILTLKLSIHPGTNWYELLKAQMLNINPSVARG